MKNIFYHSSKSFSKGQKEFFFINEYFSLHNGVCLSFIKQDFVSFSVMEAYISRSKWLKI